MNVNNYTNWNLIKYSTILGSLILLNYFLWSINSWQILKYTNFVFLSITFIYFFVSKKYKDYWHLKIIILLLLLISLGTPTLPNDARYIYIFSGKILFYESNLYVLLENHLSDIVTTRPKLPATLSATFAQLVGSWNEIFPKSTNIIIILPPIIFLISFFKDQVLILLWLFLMLFFSGKLFVNGLMDGILALYFVSSILISYKISITKEDFEKKLLYFTMFIFFVILSLCKNEGSVMILVILLSSIIVDLIFIKKINYKLLSITFLSLCPFIIWKYFIIKNSVNFTLLEYESGDPISRFLGRITNSEDLLNILSFLVRNEKLLLSLTIFIFCGFKFFNQNKKLIFFIATNFLLYFSILIIAYLVDPFDLLDKLNQSSTRVFVPLVLMLTYFAIFLINDEYSLRKK